MRHITVLLGLVGLVACSSDDDGPPRPTSCTLEQRAGTYLMALAEVSGTCGPIPSGLVTFGSAPTRDPKTGEGCVLLRPDQVSEGGCKLDREVECVTRIEDATVYGGWYMSTSSGPAVTRQVTADGSRIEGIMTITITNQRGSCTSTYNVTATRQ